MQRKRRQIYMSFLIAFECGCKIPRYSCESDYITLTKAPRLLCPVHRNGTKTAIIFVCECCRQDFLTDKRGNIFDKVTGLKYCPECKLKRKKLLENKYTGERRNGKKVKKQEPIPKPDCKFYSLCLDKICRDPFAKAVSCNDCIRYECKELDIMDYIKADDTCFLSACPGDLFCLPRGITAKNAKQTTPTTPTKPKSKEKARTSYLFGYNSKTKAKSDVKAKKWRENNANTQTA